MTFTIKTQTFEGPLDLLLDLIEKRKLFISDISLAKVTDDFIAHVRQFEQMPVGESAHFILIASTLLLIKSKSLLPDLSLTDEEKGDIRDLETRLKIYKRIKDSSINIQKMFGEQIIFPCSQGRVLTPVFAPDPQFTLSNSLNALRELINKLPKKENLPQHLVKKVISLEEMIGALTVRVTKQMRMSFKEFTKDHKENRVNIIVSFLAMLELVKGGLLQVSQDNAFGDIVMESGEIGVPHYK